MYILEIFENYLSYLALVPILIIFLLGFKKNKKNINKINSVLDEGEEYIDIDRLKNYEEKLIVLKDLYKQELIDSDLYKKKIELIVKKIEVILGKDFKTLPNIQQKIIMDSLKNDIKLKVKNKIDSQTVTKKSIDSLIDAVDNKIKKGKRL